MGSIDYLHTRVVIEGGYIDTTIFRPYKNRLFTTLGFLLFLFDERANWTRVCWPSARVNAITLLPVYVKKTEMP